jgi:hypothetical protein
VFRSLTFYKDLSAIARLVGIKFFLTEAAHEQIADANALRRARQERAAMDGEPDGIDDPVIITQESASKRIQSQFEERVIRRTAESLNPDGSPLIYMPALHIQHFYLNLLPRELSILEGITELSLEK